MTKFTHGSFTSLTNIGQEKKEAKMKSPVKVVNLQSVVPSSRHKLVGILRMIGDAEHAVGVAVNLARAQALLEE